MSISGNVVTVSNNATKAVPSGTAVEFATGVARGFILTQDMPVAYDWFDTSIDCSEAPITGPNAGQPADVLRVKSISVAPGGAQYMTQIDCLGRVRATNGIFAGSSYSNGPALTANGLLMNGFGINGILALTFNGSNALITGGGSTGLILYGSNQGTGSDGKYIFRNNPTDNTQGASIDAGTGNAAFGNLFAAGHIAGIGTAPTLSASAGTATLSAGANDNHGTITNGSSANDTVTLTFATARTNVPDCIVQAATASGGGISRPAAPTATTLQVTLSAAGGQATYICMGQ